MPFLLFTAVVPHGKKHGKYRTDCFSLYVPLYGLTVSQGPNQSGRMGMGETEILYYRYIFDQGIESYAHVFLVCWSQTLVNVWLPCDKNSNM